MSLVPETAINAPPALLKAGIDTAIDNALSDKRLVGAVVLVTMDGRSLYRRAAGLADRENGIAMREDAIFRLASVTKPIVTIAAMRLVEQGRLRLDDAITRWLPAFRPCLADGTEPVIRIRHLLTHTAGLTYGFTEPDDGPYARAGVSDGIGEPGLPLAENLRRIAGVPLGFPPGEGWQYSVAMDVLGAVIEQETGVPLGQTVAELVTKPLGLEDTAFFVRDRNRLAAAYMNATPEPLRMGDRALVPALTGSIRVAPDRIFDPASYHSGGAGMAGTADDILVVLETIRNGGAPLLAADTVKTMMEDQAGGHVGPQRPGFGFGFGWSVVTNPTEAMVPFSKGTLQWGGVYGHSWFVDPVKKLTVVALTNTALEGMWGRFTVDLRNAVYAGV